MALSNIEERILKDYYPRELQGNFHIPRSHGIKSNGFTSYKGFNYAYSIQSPSSGSTTGERRYLLATERTDVSDRKRLNGIVAEEIMRITVIEFFRRISANHGIVDFSFIKRNSYPEKTIMRESENYTTFHQSRYNIVVIPKTITAKATEYDGILYYNTSNTKGIVVCESKSGALQYLANDSEKGRKEIKSKLIDPLKELFPEHHIDFLLMAHKTNLFSKVSERTLRPRLNSLNTYLNSYDIGFIPFYFPDSKKTMQTATDDMVTLRNTVNSHHSSLSDLVLGKCHFKGIKVGSTLIIAKQQRIEMVLKRNNDGYRIIYENNKNLTF